MILKLVPEPAASTSLGLFTMRVLRTRSRPESEALQLAQAVCVATSPPGDLDAHSSWGTFTHRTPYRQPTLNASRRGLNPHPRFAAGGVCPALTSPFSYSPQILGVALIFGKLTVIIPPPRPDSDPWCIFMSSMCVTLLHKMVVPPQDPPYPRAPGLVPACLHCWPRAPGIQ